MPGGRHERAASPARLKRFADSRVCLACKGFAAGADKLNHRLVERALGCPVAVLSGPSFAGEVAQKLPTAVTLAATDPAVAEARIGQVIEGINTAHEVTRLAAGLAIEMPSYFARIWNPPCCHLWTSL